MIPNDHLKHLVLTRHAGETICLDRRIAVHVVQTGIHQARLLFAAPADVVIERLELLPADDRFRLEVERSLRFDDTDAKKKGNNE